jgi:hypothetical protein
VVGELARLAVVVVAAPDGGGLVGAVEVVLDCFADELHAASRTMKDAAHVRRTRRG